MTIEIFRQTRMRPFRLLQITDSHLGSQPGEELLGLDTDQSLRDVLDMSQMHDLPDLILATGDISGDGGLPSYERFIAIVKEYYPSIPLAWLPGNHDESINMAKIDKQPINFRYEAPGWKMLFLNSRIPNEVGGRLSVSELERLESELAQNPDLPTLVFMHHQPVPVGSAWVDKYVLENAKAFFDVIDKYNNIKTVCWGHVHQEFSQIRKGVPMLATPSTCVQFKPNQDDFQVDRAMPGYRSFTLLPNGMLETDVLRIEEKTYKINYASSGY